MSFPDDPRIELLRGEIALHPLQLVERTHDAREAAVALVLRARESLEVLLIKRSERQSDPWSGHMALPGGRRDAADADLCMTAVRETREETGIDVGRIGRLLGPLDEVEPRSRRLPVLVIAPFVFAVAPDTVATPDPREVEAALWVSIEALRHTDAAAELVLELEGGSRSFPSIRYQEHVIWGLTHRILTQFLAIAETCGV
jgi:8-oxo-dGTP pyrophosphatase MutT (NUDIX family)